MQRQTPMALAETASIFCETIMVEAGLAATAGRGSAWACSTPTCRAPARWWSTSTAGSCSSRELCARRGAARTLSVAELNELMLDAQRQAYGDGLDPTRCTRTCGR